MLGLGISKSAQGVKSGIVKLLNSLKRRAEYFENKNDSKSEIKVLKDYELLDKATILLTPTATSDARVHSVKTYTGDELVTNGDFSDGSNGWFVTNGNVTDKYNASMTAYQSGIKITPFNKTGTYRVTFDLVVTSGSCKFDAGGGNDEIFSTSGSKTIYVTNTLKFEFNAFNLGWVGSLDNVSVVDVSSDFDFDRASSATRINSSGLVQDMQSITDPELVLNGDFEELGSELVTNGSFDTDSDWTLGSGWSIEDGVATSIGSNYGQQLKQTILQTNKIYKLSFDIVDYTSGNIALESIYYGVTQTFNGIGSYVTYFTSLSQTEFRLYSQNFIGSLDNVSVQQVDPNDRWSLGAGWSIEDGKLVGDGTMTASDTAVQSYNFIDGNTYKFSFEITESSQGSVFIREPFNGVSDAVGTVGTHTFNYVAGAANELKLRSDDNFTGKIDNISVKDITFSTDVDLARINYDSNGENGHILLEPTSENKVTYSEDFSEWTNTDITFGSDGVSPSGETNANLIQTGTAGSDQVSKVFTLSATNTTTYSVFIKRVSGAEWIDFLIVKSGFSNSLKVWFDINNGTVGSNNATGTTTLDSASIEDYGNDWYRLIVTTTDTTNNTSFNIRVRTASADGLDTRVNNSSYYLWGMQLEALPYATSYIPTLTGSTVTRATETLTGSGNSTLINTAEGTLYLESKLSGLTGTKLFSLGAGTNNADPAVLVGYTGSNMYFDFVDGGSLVNSPDIRIISGINTNSYNKMAISYTSTSVTVFLNGVKKVTKSGVDFTPTNNLKALYAGYGTGSKFEGEVKAVEVFNEALSDDELELLTGVTNYSSFAELAAAGGYTII